MISIAKILKIITIISIFSLMSCGSDDSKNLGCIPNSTINVSINLNLVAYQSLQSAGGWIYYSGPLAGSRGLIIVNNGNGVFKAYDRNAPHICPTNNSTLEVQSDIIIVCPEDGAQWILTSGEPIEIANQAPIRYFTSLNGSILSVYN